MKTKILITGASGFLGSWLIRLLLRDTACEIVALVRGETNGEAEWRLRRLWHHRTDIIEEIGRRVRVVKGDLCSPQLGFPRETYQELVTSVTHIIHAAADLNINKPVTEIRRVNVGGTAALLEIAKAINRDHGLHRFSHISTAYVAGGRRGEVIEEDLTDSFGFSNNYELTKYEGEVLVRSAMNDIPISVFRPGMIVGDSQSGEVQTFNTLYVPLRLYLSGKLKLIPTSSKMRLNLIPVNYVAEAVTRLTIDPSAAGCTFHLTVDSEHLPTVKDVLHLTRDWAVRNLGTDPGAVCYIPLSHGVSTALKSFPGIPSGLLTYFSEDRRYVRRNTDRLLGPYVPNWQELIPRLLEYATSRCFLHHTGRTVHEQLVNRLQSKKIPLRIHDLPMGGGLLRRSGSEMCREIGDAVKALRSMGIVPGDRVAIVGLNSSRFLSLDTAIGLTGAVSVPLYYTSPAGEINEILQVSNARLLFIGAPSVLERAAEICSSLPIVSFCTTPLSTEPPCRVKSWDAFLALGKSAGKPDIWEGDRDASRVSERRHTPRAPVGLTDLSTLRFTSGTSGSSKGVQFRHSQVLWLAETIAALLPWKARTSPARYLSFLPMNHVVEGILGTYGPAYMPVPVDIFFLEDFHALSRVLPRIRPTVFFSVPRFYEKVWERFCEKPIGRLYLTLPRHGPGKFLNTMICPLIKAVLLKRAGLNRCVQLIAGSAPCSESLLRHFRELGIEIHNAYGLTEAPLVTLNRHGANKLGTVGVPLPETELRIAHDGEVLVRGPQVTCGEFAPSTESIVRGGWLYTGDLGTVEEDGSLRICGRKKEILITSYGKNIHPGKIENKLREIPDIAEVMIIGESRPVLSALLWLRESNADPVLFKKIDESLRGVNRGLSHPEQVKRWALLAESPTIESGELTGNLKLRRQVVLSQRSEIVELLYDGWTCANPVNRKPAFPGVLHIGEDR